MTEQAGPNNFYELEKDLFQEIGGYVYKLVVIQTHEGVLTGWQLQHDHEGTPLEWVPVTESKSPEPDDYAMAVPLSDDEMFTAAVEVVGLIKPDGSQAYRVRTSDGPLSTRVGLVELAKVQMILDMNENQ